MISSAFPYEAAEGHRHTHGRILGYRNRGGTLDVAGMLFANGCTWAHVLHAAAQLLAVAPDTLLDSEDCRN